MWKLQFGGKTAEASGLQWMNGRFAGTLFYLRKKPE
jgi:hypothetical protein